MMRLFLLAIMSLIFVSALQSAYAQETRAEVTAVLHGEALAKANCSRCHSVGLKGESPNANAPSFRSFSSYRSVELISWMLIDKTTPKHSQMPHFEITPEQALDIVSWIKWVQPVPHGKRLVEKNCSSCHAIGLYDENKHPAAIAFRDISIFYPVEALEGAFAEGIETGHPDMPVFEVDITQLQDMLAYIETLQLKLPDEPQKN